MRQTQLGRLHRVMDSHPLVQQTAHVVRPVDRFEPPPHLLTEVERLALDALQRSRQLSHLRNAESDPIKAHRLHEGALQSYAEGLLLTAIAGHVHS